MALRSSLRNRRPITLFHRMATIRVCLSVAAIDSTDLETCAAVVCHTLEVNALGLADLDQRSQLQVWPVPFEQRLMIRGELEGMVQFSVFDLSGRLAAERTIAMSGEIVLELPELALALTRSGRRPRKEPLGAAWSSDRSQANNSSTVLVMFP
jgi:hypothetical protein